ncbi:MULTISPECIES: efflux RND transporter periplasmic adaptor subunit [unclassified Streptomyces]|uniref:efflux RND transporter periplasmic adaptor subunit n=1 Tax=Streptomyces sp. NPDC005955 TaxID=3364738 RepID=UPI003676A856
MSTTQLPTDDGTADAAPPDDGKGRRARRKGSGRRRWIITAVVVVLAAAGAGVVVLDPFAKSSDDSSSEGTTRTGVAEVTKGTLAARTQTNGTLGYAGSYKVVNKSNGTLTKLPRVGEVIRQGKVLYRVDGKPVVFLQGAYVPAYRKLAWNMEGVDVQQLNSALLDMGYADKGDIDPDSDYYGWQTYYAVKELQDDLGLKVTGELELGQAVFLSAKEIRITKVGAVSGSSAAPGSVVVEGSSTQRQVSVALRASQQADVKKGDKVTISLPSGQSTPGVVSSVGKVATKSGDGMTVEVLIKPSKPKDTGQLDQAPVQVSIVSGSVKDVLSVPVNALLAQAGGGYAVEVVDAAGERRLVKVETGLFDDSAGRVQVTGDGLSAGQNVVVPGS